MLCWALPSVYASSRAGPGWRRRPRVGTPSLARTAETWWSTVLAEMNSRAAISALVCPAADQVEHLALAPGQPERVLPGCRRGARSGSTATPSRRSLVPDDPGGRRRAEVGRGWSSARRSAASSPAPRPAPAPPRTGSPDRVHASAARSGSPSSCSRYGSATGPRTGRPDPVRRQPHRDRAAEPGVERRRARRRPARPRAGPRRSAPRASTPRPGPAAPALSYCGSPVAVGGGGRLVEARPDVGVTAAGPDQAQPDQRAQPVDRGRRRPGQQFRELSATRLVPPAGALQRVGPLAAQAGARTW